MKTITKRNRHFGYLLLGAGLTALTAAACSDDPRGAGCSDDLQFFEANVWKPILSQKCVVCHSKDGLAKGTRLVLAPPSSPGYLEANFETAKKLASVAVDGTSVLLLRPSGRHPAGHPGGTLFEFQSPEYKTLATFVGRVTQGKGCDAPIVSCALPTPGSRLLRRLSRGEYDATVHDLFGVDSRWGAAFTPDTVVNGFDNNSAALRVSPLLADQARKAAEEIADQAMKTPASVLPCDPLKDGDASCAGKFIDVFGKRAFRRPLTAADRTRYLGLYNGVASGDGFNEGVKAVIAAMLQSPHFLYRMELGDDAPGASDVKLTPHEIASELSYFLWGSMPDDALFAAADSGALSSPVEIEKQAQRLLADPRSDAVLERFVEQWLEIDRLPNIAKDAATYPEFDPAARASLREETRRFVSYVVRSGAGTLPELLTANYSFMSPALEKLYGISAPAGTPDADGYAKVDLTGTARAGILTQGSVLATHSKPNSSSPIHRGKLVRERIFCQALPPPPPGLNAKPPAFDPSLTTRQRYAAHATSEPCVSCHKLMDPVGFGFEHFDGIGRYRDDEGGKSIDATGQIAGTPGTDGVFDGTSDLASHLARSPDVHACFALQWVRFGYGVEEDADLSCLAGQVSAGFEKGGLRIADLMVALTRTSHFTQRVSDGIAGGPGPSGGSGAGGGMATSSASGGPGSGSGAGGGGPASGITVVTTIDSQWATGYQESVKITNTSGAPVTWTVTLDVGGKITDLWNATATPAGAKTTFVGKDYNATLDPQATTSFGFVVAK